LDFNSLDTALPADSGCARPPRRTLALSCQGCNNAKYIATEGTDPLTGQPAGLFHPRLQRWQEHFVWSHDFALIHGLTPTGRATVDKLQLNCAGVVNLRRVLHNVGEHPPKAAEHRDS
jgi:hypothetical protein